MNSFTKLFGLAVGAFAIGTESYVVAGVLPTIASDLGVSVPVAGQLITAFALTYAIGSPLIAVATSSVDRRRLLIASIATFGVFNLVAAFSHSYGWLLTARIGMGLAAGTFMPAASAYAVAATKMEHRGRALSIIYGGLTVAMVIGAPVGVLLGEHFGWRFIFIGVAGLVFAALASLTLGLKPVRHGTVPSLGERIAIARRPDVLGTLAVTVVTLAGVYTIYSYLAPFLQQTANLTGDAVALIFFVFGLGSTAGNFISGGVADRIGPRRVIAGALLGLVGIFATLSFVGVLVPAGVARWLVVPLIALWGLVGWSFPSAQQAHIAALAPKFASITLSLNASAIYLGASLGAMIGSVVVAHGAVHQLGWAGAACEAGAFALLRFARRRRSVAIESRPPAAREPVLEI
ncbi:MAG TPA: MFS transporter [Opitutus sp.]|nr:MFS transporter [Opitutus sp.]